MLTEMKLNFKWTENKGQYSSGESLRLNRITVGSYGWNSSRSKDDGLGDSIRYAGRLELPSLSDKGKHLYASSPEEVKAKVELAVTSWFKEALGGSDANPR